MRVMRVWHVRMGMAPRFVTMQVAVHADGRVGMGVVVVPVVVAVRVLVRQRLVRMRVAVSLDQVQHEAGEHQQRRH